MNNRRSLRNNRDGRLQRVQMHAEPVAQICKVLPARLLRVTVEIPG